MTAAMERLATDPGHRAALPGVGVSERAGQRLGSGGSPFQV